MKILARNRKATFNYEVLEKLEAGMVLLGWQVKSIKAGNVNLTDAYAFIQNGEVLARNIRVAPWSTMGDFEREYLDKDIKLLLNRHEIARWEGKLQQQSATAIIPTKIFLSKGLIKLELALAKGVKKYDKRAKIKEREQKREISRELKQNKYF